MTDLDFWGLIVTVQQRYPQLLPILQKPGVWDVVANAIADNWPQERLQAGLQATPYYQTTRIEERQWDVLQATDPATAWDRQIQAKRMVDDTVSQLGLVLDPTDQWYYEILAATNQWDAQRTRYELLLGGQNGTKALGMGGGELGAIAAKVKGTAEDYGMPMNDDAVINWSRRLAAGTETEDSYKGSLSMYAKALYPALKDQIDQGMTVRDFATPYLNLAAQELGTDPNSLLLTDPKWTNLFLNHAEDKGTQTVRSLQDAQRTIRTDAQYGFDSSANATKTAAQLGTQLQQKFGVSA